MAFSVWVTDTHERIFPARSGAFVRKIALRLPAGTCTLALGHGVGTDPGRAPSPLRPAPGGRVKSALHRGRWTSFIWSFSNRVWAAPRAESLPRVSALCPQHVRDRPIPPDPAFGQTEPGPWEASTAPRWQRCLEVKAKNKELGTGSASLLRTQLCVLTLPPCAPGPPPSGGASDKPGEELALGSARSAPPER